MTLKQVNKAIQAKYPEIELVKGKGYFYVYSENDEIGLKLAGLYTTSIDVFALNRLTIDLWIRRVEYVLQDKYRFNTLEQCPVYPEKFLENNQ